MDGEGEPLTTLSKPSTSVASTIEFSADSGSLGCEKNTASENESPNRVRQTAEARDSSSNPKFYKTTLCQFYLQGPCKNGDRCSFAHGTSELRTVRGLPVSEADSKIKTKLCERFLQYGSCPFGASCTYAHGVRELQSTAANPAYKTSLCRTFTSTGACSFGSKCQYAHGSYELRTPVSAQGTSNVRTLHSMKTVVSHPRQYKTVMCKNGPDCKYGERCQFAHSQFELRKPPNEESSLLFASSSPNASDGAFKTTLCKYTSSHQPCPFGTSCRFAHGEHELRVLTNGTMTTQYDTLPLGTGSLYKTSMCNNILQQNYCLRGPDCHFAHSPEELRSPSKSSAGLSMTVSARSKNLKVPRYKTVMCTNITKSGQCTRGLACGFAHSCTEMMQAREMDPKYKTVLCEIFKRDGKCDRGLMCIFAHGPGDLRHGTPPNLPTGQSSAMPAAYLGSGGGFVNNTHAFTNHRQVALGMQTPQLYNPKYKTMLCQSFMANGSCERQDSCSFAHGSHDLVNSDSYKTSMCRNVGDNEICPKGILCHFAHSIAELRSSGGEQSSRTSSVDNQFGYKRKQANAKTVLCNNFETTGFCRYGESCSFAHGPEELQLNKRQRVNDQSRF